MLDPVARRRPQSCAEVRAALKAVPLARDTAPTTAPAWGRWAPSALPVVHTPAPAEPRGRLRSEDWLFLVVPALILATGWIVRLAIA
jgi:hypothetical protein